MNASAVGDTVEIGRLKRYLDVHVTPSPDLPEVGLLAGGRSGNVTLSVDHGGRRLVLRRPPLGEYDAQAYDPRREYQFLAALQKSDVPVPGTVALGTDVSVLGFPFFVMERVEGRILTRVSDSPELADPRRRFELGVALVRALADLHDVVPEDVGLGNVGRPDGFVERQVRRWTGQWASRRQRDLPGFDELGARLLAVLEQGSVDLSTPRPVIVHGDFNLSNVMFASTDFTPVAVLDWEQATIGHPLVDLGVLAAHNGTWQDLILSSSGGIGPQPGFPTSSEVSEIYARASGTGVDDFDFFLVLAIFKILVITEDIRQRHLAGLTTGAQYEGLGDNAAVIADMALEVASASGIAGLSGRHG